MQYDRQSIAQSLVEVALHAAADPSVTAVIRDWDWYGPGDTAQPLCPFLAVSLTDDTPYGVGIGLYRAQLQVMICVVSSPSIRDDFDRIRGSVRSVMASLRGLAAAGVVLSAALETSCSAPANLNDSGDVVYAQSIGFTLWYEAPPAPAVVLDPEIFLVDKSEPGVTYVTRQAQDPRRIERWIGPVNALQVAYAFGTWSDRASLAYFAPSAPPETSRPVPSDPITPTTADQPAGVS